VRLLEYRSEDEQGLLDFALEESVALTSSAYGYIFIYDAATRLFPRKCWSSAVLRYCLLDGARSRYSLEEIGLWGEAVRQRRAIIENDFDAPSPWRKGVPSGHVPLERFLSVPLFIDDRIAAVVAVANKAEPYDERDAQQLSLLLTPVFARIERERADARASEVGARFAAVVSSMDDLVITLDADGRYTGLYGKWFERDGVDTRQFLGKNFSEVFGEGAAPHLRALEKARAEGKASYEWSLPSDEPGAERIFQTVFSAIERNGRLVGFVGVGRDLSAMVVTERRLSALLREKTALVQEVQHRVKNNLQIVVSLIELQLSAETNATREEALRVLESRAHALACVHTMIAEAEGGELVVLSSYLRSLVQYFLHSTRREAGSFGIALQSDDTIALSADVAVPVSLAVHELVLNCLSHAVPAEGERLEVSIRTARIDEFSCEIAVADNGSSAADGGEWRRDGVGLMLVEGLVSQIKGRIDRSAGGGCRTTLRFPVEGAGRPQLPDSLANGYAMP